MKNKLAIIGSGDLGQQIAQIALKCNYEVIGYYDDFNMDKTAVDGHQILGATETILEDFKQNIFSHLFIGIGYKHMLKRAEIFIQFKNQIPFANIIHPSCIVEDTVKLGEGIVLYPGCVIDSGAELKDNILVNVGSIIAHHTTIGSHCFLSPGVTLAGFITIEENCFIGINSTIVDNITIKKGVQLGGGTVVIKNIDQSGLYVGNPARFVR